MQHIEVDWAGDEAPRTGVVSNEGDDVTVVVQLVEANGVGGGWPVYGVWAFAGDGVHAYREAMELDAWLEVVYGCEDEEQREDMLANA